MNFIIWIIFGALAGWIASVAMRGVGQGLVMDVVMGILGALLGGFIMNFFGKPGITGFNLYSLLIAVLGAIVLIYIGRLFGRGGTYRA
jgi:uncharacterized membrane protein YeaQ/YmgE (transglycosylase-associated protein family)